MEQNQLITQPNWQEEELIVPRRDIPIRTLGKGRKELIKTLIKYSTIYRQNKELLFFLEHTTLGEELNVNLNIAQFIKEDVIELNIPYGCSIDIDYYDHNDFIKAANLDPRFVIPVFKIREPILSYLIQKIQQEEIKRIVYEYKGYQYFKEQKRFYTSNPHNNQKYHIRNHTAVPDEGEIIKIIKIKDILSKGVATLQTKKGKTLINKDQTFRGQALYRYCKKFKLGPEAKWGQVTCKIKENNKQFKNEAGSWYETVYDLTIFFKLPVYEAHPITKFINILQEKFQQTSKNSHNYEEYISDWAGKLIRESVSFEKELQKKPKGGKWYD